MKGRTEMGQKQNVHPFSGHRGRSRGFTTIEILTVVSLIILLSGIGIVAGTRMMAEGKKEQMRAMLVALVGANEEFKAKRQQGNINHEENYPMNWKKIEADSGWGLTSSERFVYSCKQVKSAESMMLAAVMSGESETRKAYKDTGPNPADPGGGKDDSIEELYDVWGTEIAYRSFNSEDEKLPLSKTPFFVSAGPDKTFGTEDDITSIQDPVYKED